MDDEVRSRRHGANGGSRRIAVWLLIAVASVCEAVAQEPSIEYQVKASYLYNFTRFVDWPDDAVVGAANFNLCVVGAWRFGGALEGLNGERVEDRPLSIRRLPNMAGAMSARCHLLFIGRGELDAAREVVAARGLLTVGEEPGFLVRGGIINLIETSGRIRFEVNQKAAEHAGLAISSRMLRLALEAR